jgi:hypothetical protein
MKRCIKCSETKPLSEFHRDTAGADGWRSACKPCVIEQRRLRRQTDPEGHRKRRRAQKRRARERNPQKFNAAKNVSAGRCRATYRTRVFDHYGWACTCCGSTEDLTIDHVYGTGRTHRLELFGYVKKTGRIYIWLIREGFPDGFTTLCRRCNSSKRTGFQCRIDHESED